MLYNKILLLKSIKELLLFQHVFGEITQIDGSSTAKKYIIVKFFSEDNNSKFRHNETDPKVSSQFI